MKMMIVLLLAFSLAWAPASIRLAAAQNYTPAQSARPTKARMTKKQVLWWTLGTIIVVGLIIAIANDSKGSGGGGGGGGYIRF